MKKGLVLFAAVVGGLLAVPYSLGASCNLDSCFIDCGQQSCGCWGQKNTCGCGCYDNHIIRRYLKPFLPVDPNSFESFVDSQKIESSKNQFYWQERIEYGIPFDFVFQEGANALEAQEKVSTPER